MDLHTSTRFNWFTIRFNWFAILQKDIDHNAFICMVDDWALCLPLT